MNKAGDLLEDLRGIRVVSCAKVHEKPGNSFRPPDCPHRRTNASCGHSAEAEYGQHIFKTLGRASGKLISMGLRSQAEHREMQDALFRLFIELNDVDDRASAIYSQEGPQDLSVVREEEVRLGQEILQIRDGLLILLEESTRLEAASV